MNYKFTMKIDKKPTSILRFEQFYWVSTLIYYLNMLLDWRYQLDDIRADGTTHNTALLILIFTNLFSIIVSLAIWHFIINHKSRTVKWIFIVLSIIGFYFFSPLDASDSTFIIIIKIIADIIAMGSLIYLFQPDATKWLGHDKARQR